MGNKMTDKDCQASKDYIQIMKWASMSFLFSFTLSSSLCSKLSMISIKLQCAIHGAANSVDYGKTVLTYCCPPLSAVSDLCDIYQNSIKP